MARKDLLKSVLSADGNGRKTSTPSHHATTESDQSASLKDGRADYALRGASRKMKASIDSLAEDARRMLEGEAIVEIATDLIDVSFVSDRLRVDDEALEELKRAIADGQQESPVLLRPHPITQGRYMIVFGHRRVRVARELGRPVRAVVKEMDDVAHVLAQGQENTARADLSFIEKALFAKSLLEMGQSKDVIRSALTVDGTLLSRMLAVAQKIPYDIIATIGPAKSIGRDRWEGLKKLVVLPTNTARAKTVLETKAFQAADSDQRFEILLSDLQVSGKPPKTRSKRKPKEGTVVHSWAAGEGRIKAKIARSDKGCTLTLTARDSGEFGEFLRENLDVLYAQFKSTGRETSK